MKIRDELFKEQDLKYRDFQSKLIPNIEKEKIIGVRIPVLRRIAKDAVKENVSINNCFYYEEKLVNGLMIGYKKVSIKEHLAELKEFVPLIDNWAVCDSCCSNLKFTVNNREIVFDFLLDYINKSEYETRFAVVMLMDYYLCDEYIDRVLELIKSVKSDFYYVNMAVAWALSVAMVKYPDKVLEILKNKTLSVWVHNKTIQKCCESYRISADDKEYLKLLKRKN